MRLARAELQEARTTARWKQPCTMTEDGRGLAAAAKFFLLALPCFKVGRATASTPGQLQPIPWKRRSARPIPARSRSRRPLRPAPHRAARHRGDHQRARRGLDQSARAPVRGGPVTDPSRGEREDHPGVPRRCGRRAVRRSSRRSTVDAVGSALGTHGILGLREPARPLGLVPDSSDGAADADGDSIACPDRPGSREVHVGHGDGPRKGVGDRAAPARAPAVTSTRQADPAG